MERTERNKTQENEVMHNTTAHHTPTGAQPVQAAIGDSQVTPLRLHTDHGIL